MNKSLRQKELADNLGISKSYLSMILSGKRNCPSELAEKLQSTQGIHKIVNNDVWKVPSKQRVVGSNPSRDANIQSQFDRSQYYSPYAPYALTFVRMLALDTHIMVNYDSFIVINQYSLRKV